MTGIVWWVVVIHDVDVVYGGSHANGSALCHIG